MANNRNLVWNFLSHWEKFLQSCPKVFEVEKEFSIVWNQYLDTLLIAYLTNRWAYCQMFISFKFNNYYNKLYHLLEMVHFKGTINNVVFMFYESYASDKYDVQLLKI